ncbi:MAG: hypothetical protein U1F77_14635 [Kiritimatiellia bacterium]
MATRSTNQLFEALRKVLRKVGRRDDLLDAFAREAGLVFGASFRPRAAV